MKAMPNYNFPSYRRASIKSEIEVLEKKLKEIRWTIPPAPKFKREYFMVETIFFILLLALSVFGWSQVLTYGFN